MKRMIRSAILPGHGDWEREQGLRLTNMETYIKTPGNRSGKRNVYRAKDGKLYYVWMNSWHGVQETSCWEKGDAEGMARALQR